MPFEDDEGRRLVRAGRHAEQAAEAFETDPVFVPDGDAQVGGFGLGPDQGGQDPRGLLARRQVDPHPGAVDRLTDDRSPVGGVLDALRSVLEARGDDQLQFVERKA